jgi:hypothetical protein
VLPVGSTNQGMTGILTWLHQFSEALSMSTTGSYGITNVTGAAANQGGGRQTSLGASVGLQYLISQTLSTTVRYAYFDRGSQVPGLSTYQNIVLIGINKQF